MKEELKENNIQDHQIQWKICKNHNAMNKHVINCPFWRHCCMPYSYNSFLLSISSLRAPIDWNSPDHPHLGPLPTCLPMGPGPPLKLRPGPSILVHAVTEVLVSSSSNVCTWLWALLIQTLTFGLSSWLDLGLALSLWSCPAMNGLCLTMVTLSRPDPNSATWLHLGPGSSSRTHALVCHQLPTPPALLPRWGQWDRLWLDRLCPCKLGYYTWLVAPHLLGRSWSLLLPGASFFFFIILEG